MRRARSTPLIDGRAGVYLLATVDLHLSSPPFLHGKSFTLIEHHPLIRAGLLEGEGAANCVQLNLLIK